MSCECISSRWQLARKQHPCAWCGQKITAGEQYLRERMKFEGDMFTQRFHKECDAAFRAAIVSEGGGPLFFEPGSQPRGGSNPDNYGDTP